MPVDSQFPQQSSSPPRLRIVGLDKSFGGTHALRGIDLTVEPGRIHGLIGENGAGKSTLIRCVTGVIQADRGRVELDAQPLRIASPRDAQARGIAVVHQEAACFGELSVAENMLLPDQLVRFGAHGPVNWPGTRARARQDLDALHLDLDVRQPASRLSVAERMLMQIAANVALDVRVLFLDEPSAALTQREADLLFAQVRRLAERGVAVIFVSHRLAEVRDLCSQITVLRDGQAVWTKPTNDVSLQDMVGAMVGRDVDVSRRRATSRPGEPLLQVTDLSDAAGRFAKVDLTVSAGEVVGLYGLVGAGRSELAQALFGLGRLASGQVELLSKAHTPTTPSAALASGLAYLPEDRLVQGVFGGLSVWINATISTMGRWSRVLLRRFDVERRHVDKTIADMHVALADPQQPIETLSGGNQQKILLGRYLGTGARVLLLDEPTRGVDVGAKAEIHDLICKLADEGDGVLAISSELPELLQISDRIVVMREGRVSGELPTEQATEQEVVALSLPTEDRASHRAGTISRRSRLMSWFRDVGLLVAVMGVIAAMSVARPDAFATWQNAVDVASSVAILAILAVGATLVIAVGGIDISVGSMMGLIGATAGLAARDAGLPPVAAFSLAVAMGTGLGLVNAGVSMLGRIHPIVVTLAGITIYRGIMLGVTGGYEVMEMPDAYLAIGHGRLGPLPKVIWFALGVIAAGWIFLAYTPVGRRLLAVGGSVRAAEQLGISRRAMTLLAFGINGALVGLAGVLHSAYYTKVQSNTGEGMELQAIAAAVIGGCAITGGTGSALGTALGAILIGLVYNSLVLLQVSSYWHLLFVGLFILSAVVFDTLMRRR